MCKKFDVEASILYGQTDLIQNEMLGQLTISLSGSQKNEAIQYLNDKNIQTEVI